MKVYLIRLFLRIGLLGFILGKFKKKDLSNGRSRGFVDVVFPLPASHWTRGNDFLWESKKLISMELKKGDLVVFFGYRTPSGWRAKWIMKLY